MSNKFISSKQPTPHMVLNAGNIQQFQRLTITGHNGMLPKMNEILVESQKMIYAPPSREKSKQTMRSPMLDKQPTQNINAPIAGSVTGFGGLDEYNLM